MVMPNDRRLKATLRVAAVGFGVTAMMWGVFEFPTLRVQSATDQIASRILIGEVYKPEILLKQISLVESTEQTEFCHPLTRRGEALIRIRIAEISAHSNLGPGSDRTSSALDAVRKS